MRYAEANREQTAARTYRVSSIQDAPRMMWAAAPPIVQLDVRQQTPQSGQPPARACVVGTGIAPEPDGLEWFGHVVRFLLDFAATLPERYLTQRQDAGFA
jgi:hypothetical protein